MMAGHNDGRGCGGSAGRAQTASAANASKSDFFDRVWVVVADIPLGKVTTYGHIAEYLGSKSAARTVGWALNAAAGHGLPCHRVVNRYGGLSGQAKFGGPHIMEDMLRSEGIEFVNECVVDIERHLWIPGRNRNSVRG